MTDSDMDGAGLQAEITKLKSELDALKQCKLGGNSELCQSEQRLALMMDGLSDGLWDWNIETGEVYFSPHWKSMLGYENHELENDFQTWKQLIVSADRAHAVACLERYLDGETDAFETEFRMQHCDGHEVFVLSRGVKVLRQSDGKAVRMIGSHVDISASRHTERYLARQADILEMIAIGRPASDVYDAIALMYEERNPGMRCSMLELEGNKLLHGGAPSLPKAYCEAVHGLENGPSVGSCGTSTYTGKRVLVENIETDPKWAKIKHVALPHGMRCCWSEPIKSSSGSVLGAFGMYYNHPALPNEQELEDLIAAARLAGIVMERDQAQKRIRQLAYFDILTGLPSRASFLHNLDMNTSRRQQRPLALLYIDLDDFKAVNDSLGHDAGDTLLKEVSARLHGCCRDGDFVARLSGDEFCVLTEAAGSSEAVSVANRCMKAICEPVEICNRKLQPACSIGIASFPADAQDSCSLLKAADTALYAAKGRGKNQYAFYQQELTEKVQYRLQIEQSFRDAIENELLELVFQPQLDLNSGEITGVETLCYWEHPQLGKMTSAELVETADRIGMSRALTEWMLRQICHESVVWQLHGCGDITVSIAVSPKLFEDRSASALIQQVFNQVGDERPQFELQLTESMLKTGQDAFVNTEELKKMGIHFTITDFVVGATSFKSVKRVGPSSLKIDRYLIEGMLADEASMVLVQAIIQLGSKLGLRVIANGVGCSNQYEVLKQNGCDSLQGELFSPPVTSEELIRLIQTSKEASSTLLC